MWQHQKTAQVIIEKALKLRAWSVSADVGGSEVVELVKGFPTT